MPLFGKVRGERNPFRWKKKELYGINVVSLPRNKQICGHSNARKQLMTEKELPSAEQQQAIEALREAIERTVGKKIQTPKDFDFLSQLIEERCGEHMSVSTLKRVWGYVTSNSLPRRSTLNILAQLIGKQDWDDFCASEHNVDTGNTQKSDSQANQKKKLSKRIPIIAAIVLAGFIAIIYLICKQRADSSRVLLAGETFATTDEYLDLFDVQDRQAPWSIPVPNHPGLIIWGAKYKHPDWHNEGNADSLMPTITEYWQPSDTTGFTTAAIAIRNADNYLRVKTFAELRITFMKELSSDSSYTFLGVYTLDTIASDITRLVWKRVATECDLAHLDRLYQLR